MKTLETHKSPDSVGSVHIDKQACLRAFQLSQPIWDKYPATVTDAGDIYIKTALCTVLFRRGTY